MTPGGVMGSVSAPRGPHPVRGLMLPTELVAELPVAAAWLTWPDLTLGFANEHYRRLIGGLARRGDPEVMTATSNALARLLPDALATAVYAVLDLPARRLYYATAGHLPPAYVTPAGQVSYLRAAGTMLGVPGPATYVTGCRRPAPRSRPRWCPMPRGPTTSACWRPGWPAWRLGSAPRDRATAG